MVLQDWANYFVAMTGAAAALTGLIFVGLSISLNKILTIPQLIDRALESLMLLLTILIISSLCLVPGQPPGLLGAEILGITIIVWILITMLDVRIYKTVARQYQLIYAINVTLSQLAMLPYIAGAIIILTTGSVGIYWLIPAIIFSFIKSLLDAWVLLIEINR